MKTIVLCGGRGNRLGNEANYIPKAMVNVGHRPAVWHVMKRYALAGYTDFILALGSGGEMIRDYFTQYEYYINDITITLGKGKIEELTKHQESDWTVTLVDTGVTAMSGVRIDRCKQYIDSEEFMVTYADSIANVNLKELIALHRKSKKIATITGVIPPFREFELTVKNNIAVEFFDIEKEKRRASGRFINGGYMIFNKKVFNYLSSFNECKLETEVFLRLIKDKQLAVFPHHGFWRWLDTDRDHEYLNDLADKNKMFWLQE